MKTAILFVGLFVLCTALVAYVSADDNNLYIRLWDEIQKVVTPKAPEGSDTESESYKAPELFLMNTPGSSIDYETYDTQYWKDNNYEGPDPDLLRFEMTDTIPAKASYFIDSGRKVSTMYKRFLMNYINPNSATDILSEETETYKTALSRIFTADYNKTGLVTTVEAARDTASQTFNRIAALRDECLRNEAPGVCAQKMLFYQAEVDDQNLNYIVVRKELQGAEATVLALQSRNLDNILAQGIQKFFSYARSGIGGSTLFGAYMLTRYDPSDFHQWWNPNAATVSKTYKAAWMGVGVTHQSSSSKSSSSISKRAFGANAGWNGGLFRASGGVSGNSVDQSTSVTSTSETIKIGFELAQIRVYRQWFEPSLFEYYPLGMESTPINQWSDGNYNGLFQWYISKVIVAKNVSITMDKFSSQMQSSFNSMQVDASMSASYGPFKMSASVSHTNQKSRKSEAFQASGGSITIDGPQIIGYVVSRMPAFPNYEEKSEATTQAPTV